MKALVGRVLILCLAPNLALASEHAPAADNASVVVWERGKDGGNPLDALAALANLPRGTPGQPRAELREQLLSAGARIVTEDEHRIVVRGKTNRGVELKVDFNYNFENGLFIEGSSAVTGSPVK